MEHHDHPTCPHPTPSGRVRLCAVEHLESLALLCLAGFLAYSFLSGRVRFFVARYYIWLSPLAAVVLSAMLAARLRGPLVPCGCAGHDAPWRIPRSVCVAVVLAPVLVALTVRPTRFTSEGVRKRRPVGLSMRRPRGDDGLDRAIDWVLGLAASGTKASADRPAALPKEPTIVVVLDAADQCPGGGIDGQFVTLIGQCDLPAGPMAGRFDLHRLLVTCCVADAIAVSLPVVRASSAPLEAGGWVRVTGIIRFDSDLDRRQPVVHAAAVTKVPEPSEPYL